MRDLNTFLTEENFASTPQSMPNIGAISNGDISDTVAGVLTSNSGTDISTPKKKKEDEDYSESKVNAEKKKARKNILDQEYGLSHPLFDILDA